MDAFNVPPEAIAYIQSLAEQSHRDAREVFIEVLQDGMQTAKKRAFDRELLENNEAIERGEYVTEEESLTRIEAIERGE